MTEDFTIDSPQAFEVYLDMVQERGIGDVERETIRSWLREQPSVEMCALLTALTLLLPKVVHNDMVCRMTETEPLEIIATVARMSMEPLEHYVASYEEGNYVRNMRRPSSVTLRLCIDDLENANTILRSGRIAIRRKGPVYDDYEAGPELFPGPRTWMEEIVLNEEDDE